MERKTRLISDKRTTYQNPKWQWHHAFLFLECNYIQNGCEKAIAVVSHAGIQTGGRNCSPKTFMRSTLIIPTPVPLAQFRILFHQLNPRPSAAHKNPELSQGMKHFVECLQRKPETVPTVTLGTVPSLKENVKNEERPHQRHQFPYQPHPV